MTHEDRFSLSKIRAEVEKRWSKSAMMSVLSEFRTDESFDSRPSLAVLAAVFGVLSRAGPPTG
jgi:hypothetical protein